MDVVVDFIPPRDFMVFQSPRYMKYNLLRKWQISLVISLLIYIGLKPLLLNYPKFLENDPGHDLSFLNGSFGPSCTHAAHWEPAYRPRINRTN